MSGLLPDEYLSRLTVIDLDDLASRGVTDILLDMDNTVLPRGTHSVPSDIVEWVEETRAKGFGLALVSNNWHKTAREVADSIGLEIVVKAMKPLPFAFLRACHRFGYRRRQTAMVGDQLMTDIWGARALGMHTILVKPMTDRDTGGGRIARRLERLFLRGRRPTR